MLEQKKMDRFKEYGADAALKLRGELVTALQDRITETVRAANAYFDSRRKREAAIASRVEELKEQEAALEAKVNGYGPRLAEATISGNSAALGAIQTELESLESKKAAISAQIELLSGVSVAGDEGLFTEADEKARELAAFWTEVQIDLSTLSTFADGQIAVWAKVAKSSTMGGNIMPRKSVFDRVAEMRKDFEKGR